MSIKKNYLRNIFNDLFFFKINTMINKNYISKFKFLKICNFNNFNRDKKSENIN